MSYNLSILDFKSLRACEGSGTSSTYNLSILDFKYEKTNYFCRFVYVYLSTENSVNSSLKTRSL